MNDSLNDGMNDGGHHDSDGKLSVPAPAGAGEPLCASAELAERGRAFVWDVLQYGRPARAFVLRIDGQPRAYLNRCVHVPTEMDWQEGQFLDMDQRFILCSIHGATYDPVDGRCVGGPCGRGRLTPLSVQERDGQLTWYPSRDIEPVSFDPPGPNSGP
jgi:nitrite reductase/ring-hydroxylating ferredoxin subunit